MARAKELANFNIVVEKGLEQDRRPEGRLQGEAGRGQGLHDSESGNIQHTGCRSRRGELNPRSGCEHAGCCSGGSSSDIDGGAL
jgi:hypothetical protein